jgi:hypothetical protein
MSFYDYNKPCELLQFNSNHNIKGRYKKVAVGEFL